MRLRLNGITTIVSTDELDTWRVEEYSDGQLFEYYMATDEVLDIWQFSSIEEIAFMNQVETDLEQVNDEDIPF